jgi:hypothetical protein
VTAERAIADETVNGSVRVLTEVLALASRRRSAARTGSSA